MDLLGFLSNIIATAFGVLLGLWTTSIREKYIEKKMFKQLLKAAFLEVFTIMNRITSIANGIRSGDLPRQFNDPIEVIIKNNIVIDIPLTLKMVNELRPKKTGENEILFLLLQGISNVNGMKTTITNLGKTTILGMDSLVTALSNQLLRLLWNIKCYYKGKITAFVENEVIVGLNKFIEKNNLMGYIEE